MSTTITFEPKEIRALCLALDITQNQKEITNNSKRLCRLLKIRLQNGGKESLQTMIDKGTEI